MSTATKIDALAARLAVPDGSSAYPVGSGTYTYDFTGTGAVIEGGDPTKPGRKPPVICWEVVQINESQAPELGNFRAELLVDIVALVPVADTQPATYRTAACDVLDDLKAAIRGDRGLGGEGIDMRPMVAEYIRGDAVGQPRTVCAVYVRAGVYWWEDGV